MAPRFIITSLLLLSLTAYTRGQFVDFFGLNAYRQHHQTERTRTRYDVTKRPEIKQKQTARPHYDDFDKEDNLRQKENLVTPVVPYNFDTHTTTAKPRRKTTTASPSNNNNKRYNHRNNNPIVISSISNTPSNNFGEITLSPYYETYSRPASNKGRNNNRQDDNYENGRRITSNNGKFDKNFDNSNIRVTNDNRGTKDNTYGTNNGGNTNYDSNNRRTTDINRGITNNRGIINNNMGNNNNRGIINNDKGNDWGISNNMGTNNWGTGVTSNSRPDFNSYSTVNPLLNKPGVRPAVVEDNSPPITNKPYMDPFNLFPKPKDPGAITFIDELSEPEIEIGPDEDDMSNAEKMRYMEIAEQACDEYKSLNVKKVVALPLVTSPQGVEVNVTSCTPLDLPLIIGGKVTNIRNFPHMALIGWTIIQNGGYSWKCGGSLISHQYVLTAGHCTYQDKDYNVISGPPTVVQLGSSYMNDPVAQVVNIFSVIRHPRYKVRRSYYDVALIKLTRTVRFSDVIRPACLGVPPPAGRPVIATGWGRTEFGGDSSFDLRSVSFPIWDMQDCRRIWGTSLKLPDGPSSDNQVCAGDKSGGKDTCQGDSGGPAQIQDGCVWRIVAVTSVGRSCGAPDTPALYATIPIPFVSKQVFGDRKLIQRSGNTQQNGYGSGNTQQNDYGSGNTQQKGYRNGNTQQNSYRSGNTQQNGYGSGNTQQNGYRSAKSQQNGNRNGNTHRIQEYQDHQDYKNEDYYNTEVNYRLVAANLWTK